MCGWISGGGLLRRRGDDSSASGKDIDMCGAVSHCRALPCTLPGPSSALRANLLHNLQQTLAPRHARRHADPRARGFLLGLYTQQGGT
eukprot:662132-Amphidinium_carterae.2